MEEIRHKVRQGECIQFIANAYGFADATPILTHPKNRRLREQRPDMNCLYPGDIVFIPPTRGAPIPANGKSRLKIIVPKPRFRFTVTLMETKEKALADISYSLHIGSEHFEGRTDSKGLISHLFKEKSDHADLILHPDAPHPEERHHIKLEIAHLDPVETVSGLQARLSNLGYYPGAIDSENGSLTQHAIRSFQADHAISPTGKLCGETMERLNKIYG